MKNMFIYISLAVLSVLFYGCSFSFGNKYQRYADFPVNKILVLSEDIYCDSIFQRYPYRIEIKDSLAVILDLHPDSCFLHAFTYPEWQYIVSFGKRGEGPEEILSAERVRICSTDSVWVLDSNRCQITRWCLSNNKAERTEEILLDDRLIRTLDFCKIDEGFLVTDYTGNYRYHVLDKHGQIKQSVGCIPSEKYTDDFGKVALAQAWRSFMDYNHKNGVLAIVTQLGEVIEIFNLKSGEHKVCYGPCGEPVFSELGSESMPKGIKGFNDVVVSDSCIYTVFDGTPFNERINAFYSGNAMSEGGDYIYVFDFEGIPLSKTKLFYSAFGLAVLEKSLFTTSTDSNIPLHVYQ